MNRLVYTARKPPRGGGFSKRANGLPSPNGIMGVARVTHITGTAGPNGSSKYLRQFDTTMPVRVTLCGRVVQPGWYEDREPVELDPNLRYHPPFCKSCLKGLV